MELRNVHSKIPKMSVRSSVEQWLVLQVTKAEVKVCNCRHSVTVDVS